MASFGEGFASGMQIGDMFRQRKSEQSIDDAGKEVAEEIQREKEFKAQQKKQLADNVIATDIKPVNPSIYQQGDSLGMQGYQTGNKPIQTTVPIAPPGYMTKSNNTSENDLSPDGLDYPSANPATDQTLLGNYNTTAALKGEKPTAEDTFKMQQDNPIPFGESTTSVIDLAKIKPEAGPQEVAKPKMLDTLNEHVIAADNAKDSYEFNMRVVRKLEMKGDARGALEYKNKVATTEFTLANADHVKFTTMQALGKEVGNLASNALEAMQQPGADVNKIFYDTLENAKVNLGYTGKVPFSMDPKENIKTLQLLEKNSLTVSEKAEMGIKQATLRQKAVVDNSERENRDAKLTLEKITVALAIGKDERESGTAAFNRLAETTKLQFAAINSVNSTLNEKDKDALKPLYDANLKTLQGASAKLNIPMPNVTIGNPGSIFATGTEQPGTKPAPTATVNPQPGATPVKPVNTLYSSGILKGKESDDTAGGYNPETPPAKTPAQEKAKAARIKFLQSKLQPNNVSGVTNPIGDAINLGERGLSSVYNAGVDIFNPSKAGQKERDRKTKELKKYQDELDALTKS